MNRLMSLSPILLSVMMVLSVISTSIAQNNKIPIISQQKKHVLKSKISGTTYHLSVSLPMHYSKTDTTHYPVLYMLDGNIAFPIAHSSRSAMDMFGELEDVIIVGIDYEWQVSRTPWMVGRWKDYTPSKDEKMDANPSYLKAFGLQPGDLSSGGGPTYLQVIKKEIIPFIDQNYKTNNDRGIDGHSFGGLFAAYSLLNSPDLFQRYGINSASLYWNNNELFQLEKSVSKNNNSLSAHIFMSVGGNEGKMMIGVITSFADSLRNDFKELNITTHIFEDEDHLSVMPANISRTLKVLYGKKEN